MTEYRHDARPNHSLRFRSDTWHDILDRAKPNPVHRGGGGGEARHRPLPPLQAGGPGRTGDLTGMTFSEAVRASLEAVAGQKCRAHGPVRISNAGAAPADDLTAELADLRTQVEEIRERMSPSVTPSPVPFRSPAAKR